MEINATLFGQMITFAIFVWFTMRFIWPPVTKALHDRQKKIADGLEAAEQGKRHLDYAEHKSAEIITQAKVKAAEIVELAKKENVQIIDEAKVKAREEGERLLMLAKAEIERERQKAREALSQEISMLAISSAEKILASKIDVSANAAMFEQLLTEIAGVPGG